MFTRATLTQENIRVSYLDLEAPSFLVGVYTCLEANCVCISDVWTATTQTQIQLQSEKLDVPPPCWDGEWSDTSCISLCSHLHLFALHAWTSLVLSLAFSICVARVNQPENLSVQTRWISQSQVSLTRRLWLPPYQIKKKSRKQF